MSVIFITTVVVVLAIAAAAAAAYIAYRYAIRCLQYDELFEMLQDDLETNIKYFKKLEDIPLVSNATEVIEAHQNMQIMSKRLQEYVLRINESRTGLFASEKKPQQPRPVVA